MACLHAHIPPWRRSIGTSSHGGAGQSLDDKVRNDAREHRRDKKRSADRTTHNNRHDCTISGHLFRLTRDGRRSSETRRSPGASLEGEGCRMRSPREGRPHRSGDGSTCLDRTRPRPAPLSSRARKLGLDSVFAKAPVRPPWCRVQTIADASQDERRGIHVCVSWHEFFTGLEGHACVVEMIGCFPFSTGFRTGP